MRRGYGNVGMSALSTIIALALPKCPLCVIGMLTVLSACGISASTYMTHLPAFTGICLGLTVVSFALPARNRQFISPLSLSLAAAVAIWMGKFSLLCMPLVYAGIAALVVAGLWNLWRSQQKTGNSCCAQSADTAPLPSY